MKVTRLVLVVVLATAVSITAVESSFAQFGKLKEKAKKAVEKKIEGQEQKKEEPKPETKDTAATASEQPADTSQAAAPAGEDFQLYTKFDFVPGQTVLFYDDLAGEEVGEFPSRWKLDDGVFEIAKVGKDPWIMGSTRGEIAPKLNLTQFPDKFTLEYEYLNKSGSYTGGHNTQLVFMGADGYEVARLEMSNNDNAYFYMKDDNGSEVHVSDKQLPAGFEDGIHTIRVMVTKSTVKAYVDNERMVNAPRTAGFKPVGFGIAFYANDEDFARGKALIRNFRFAEGGKTMREQLDESGHVALHGIYFDVNSDKIKGESYKTLADIGQMLTDDAALKLTIEGHTDSDGEDAFNMDLSQRRAEAVKKYLIETYKVDAARLDAKGFGESKPIDVNTTPEGKANNRRVELVKI